MSYHVDTKTAKEQYFLTTADLSRLPYESGGWGCGRARFYHPADLKELALEKYGEQGLMAKRQARQQKLAAKHRKEDEARLLREQLMARDGGNDPRDDKENERLLDPERERRRQEVMRGLEVRREMTELLAKQLRPQHDSEDNDVIDLTDAAAPTLAAPAAPVPLPPPPPAMDEATKRRIASLRLGCMRQAKRALGTNQYGAPGDFRFEMCGIDAPTFATLMGVPGDPELRSFVKRGAWYSEWLDGHKLFGISRSAYQQIRREIDDDIYVHLMTKLAVKFQPSTGTMSVSGSCCWEFEWDG